MDIGISVSDEEDIIEHGRPNDTFATATASLTSSWQFPAVTFHEEVVRTPDGSNPGSV